MSAPLDDVTRAPHHHDHGAQGTSGHSRNQPSGGTTAQHGHGHGAMIADFRRRLWVSLVLRAAILALSRATYNKMVQNPLWATGYNIVAMPPAAGVADPWGVRWSPAFGTVFMPLSTVIVAINAKLLQRARHLLAQPAAAGAQT